MSAGKIIICQQQRGAVYPKTPGYEVIPCWSRGRKPWNQLSPFYLQVKVNNTVLAKTFENYWQAHKVYQIVDKQNQDNWKWPRETHITDGLPNEAWQKWHTALRNNETAVRRPNGRAIPEYAWWYNIETDAYERLQVVEARLKIYIPLLKQLYRQHPLYQRLLEKLRTKGLILIDPDGPLRKLYPQGREVNLQLLEELIYKTDYMPDYPDYAPYGHAYILATCLLQDYGGLRPPLTP